MTRVLIVDDSALMRRLLSDTLSQAGFEVAVARSGEDALTILPSFDPDVVTLDVNMPGLSGLETLDRLMLQKPRPVVMISSLTSEGSETTLEALELGAVDAIEKPSGAVSLKMEAFAPAVVEKVSLAASARVNRTHRLSERIRRRQRPAAPDGPKPSAAIVSGPEPPGIVIIGASTGGPPALDTILSALPADFPWPILIAQHMPASFTGALAQRLDRSCALEIVEASGPTPIAVGRVILARGDADLVVSRRAGGLIALPTPSVERYRWHPSADRLTSSALDQLPAARLVGVLLTGMGNDGAAAMSVLRREGGFTIAESEDSAVIWGMPRELIRADGASTILPVGDIAAHLVKALSP